MSRILKKIEKVTEEALKSQVNLKSVVESSQSAQSKVCNNLNNGGRGNYIGKGQGNYKGGGCGNFNQERNNNFGSFSQGRGHRNK